MGLDADQREFFDALDDLTEQTFVSGQYAGWVLGQLRKWSRQGRPLDIDSITTWGREREIPDWAVGVLAGLTLAVEHDDDPEARP